MVLQSVKHVKKDVKDIVLKQQVNAVDVKLVMDIQQQRIVLHVLLDIMDLVGWLV